jgi:hypothetical protein
VSHVFGTIHLGVSFDELPAVVRDRLDASHTLVVEADSGDEVMAGSMDLLMLPAGQSLRAMLGDSYWAKLIEHLGATMPPAALDRFQPWLPTILLTLEDPDRMADATGMDAEIEARAKSRGTAVIYLETAADQADLLARALGIDDLKSALDDVPAARMSMKAMLRAYRAGNFAALTGLVFQPDEVAKDPEQYELMFHTRNRAWIKKLTPLLEQGGVFVAVGAGHFAGDQGLLVLLRRAGFEVTRARCTAGRASPAISPTICQ